jgi:hypothetical protein
MHNKKTAKSRGSSKGFASSPSRTGTLDQKDRFPFAGTVRPGRQLPQRIVVPGQDEVPSTLLLPDYAETGTPRRKGNSFQIMPWMIEVKSPEEIERMRQSGALARKILDYGGRQVRPGITTDEIDTLVHHAIIEVSVVCRFGHFLCPLSSLTFGFVSLGWRLPFTIELSWFPQKLLYLGQRSDLPRNTR